MLEPTSRKVDLILDQSTSFLERDRNLEAAALELIEYLGTTLRWGWVALWNMVRESNSLHAVSIWHSPLLHAADLRDFSLRWRPTAGEGMVGTAWRARKRLLSVDVVKDMVLPRSLLTKRAGLDSGLWVPIGRGETAYGVLEFLGTRDSRADQLELAMLETLAERISIFIERARR